MGNQTNDVLEILMPKLFDDVSKKICKEFSTNFDAQIVLTYLNVYIEPKTDETDNNDIMYLFSVQEERV